MYCRHCGIEMPDGTKFCPECGGQQEIVRQQPPVTELTESAQHTIIRKYCGGSLFLAASILLSAGEALRLTASDSFIPGVGSVLLIIAVWLIYSACKSSERPMKTGGFSVLRAYSVLNIVGMAIIAFACLLVGVLVIAGSDLLWDVMDKSDFYYYFDEYVYEFGSGLLAVVFFISAIIMAGVTVLTVFGYKYTDTLCKTAKGTAFKPAYSKLAAVMCFIIGGGSAIGSLSSFSAATLGSLAACAAFIIFGVIILQSEKELAAIGGYTPAPPTYYQPPQGFDPPADSNGGSKYPAPQ